LRLRGAAGEAPDLIAGLHPRFSPHLTIRCLATVATARTTQASHLGKQATKQQNAPSQPWLSDTPPVIAGDCGKIKNIHCPRPTTPLAGIGLITTDGSVVTQEYQRR
jgi:hypothetical protein